MKLMMLLTLVFMPCVSAASESLRVTTSAAVLFDLEVDSFVFFLGLLSSFLMNLLEFF